MDLGLPVVGFRGINEVLRAISDSLSMVQERLSVEVEPRALTCLTILEEDLVDLMDECEEMMIMLERSGGGVPLDSLCCRAATVLEEVQDLFQHYN